MVKDRAGYVVPDSWMNGWDKRYLEEKKKKNESLAEFTNYNVVNSLPEILGPKDVNLRILELGCGSGEAACYLAKMGHAVTAIDALPNAIEVAKRRAYVMEVENNVDFHLADMKEWVIEQESYDIIVVLQSLQYLLDHALPKLKEILNGIKQEGYFVYSGNILPHFDTEPPIRFIIREEFQTELKEWTIHRISEEEWLLRPGDRRGFLQLIAQKIPESKLESDNRK